MGLPQDEPEDGAQPSLASACRGKTREILPQSFWNSPPAGMGDWGATKEHGLMGFGSLTRDVPSVLRRMILSRATSGMASSRQIVCEAGEGFGAPGRHQE